MSCHRRIRPEERSIDRANFNHIPPPSVSPSDRDTQSVPRVHPGNTMGPFKFLKILPLLYICLATCKLYRTQLVIINNTYNQAELGYTEEEIVSLDDEKTIFTNNPLGRIECPLDDLIKVKPEYIRHSNTLHLDELKTKIMENAQILWFKNGEPLVRYNGHPVIRQLDNDTNAIIFFQPGVSDAGYLSCIANYTTISPQDRKYFNLKQGAEFRLEVVDPSLGYPDISPAITHPPTDFLAHRGSNITFTCKTLTTYATTGRHWFRSGPLTNETITNRFLLLYNQTERTRQWDNLRPFFIDGQNNDELTVNNITDLDRGYYGCLVYNGRGLDIRMAQLTVFESRHTDSNHITKLKGSIRTSPSIDSWFIASPGFPTYMIIIFTIAGCFVIYVVCNLIKIAFLNHYKKDQKTLMPTVQPSTTFNGKFDQNSGHLLAQAINIRDHSISISSDEASSYGKSHGDSYLHTSHTTATTVPLYDHPPTIHGSCVVNPLYGFLRPDAFMSGWAFPRRNLERLNKIGEGQFGEVWRFIAHQKDGTERLVAVKQLKNRVGLGDRERLELLAEIEIMKSINDHPNVIKLLHYCADDYQPILLIMEYAEHGKLQTYLRNCRSPCSAKEQPKDSDFPVSSKELVKFTYHIAKGMEYVASRGIIHRDLASRNILVSKDMVCKVADFGFARRITNECAYERTTANPVPVKWMAPEALVQNIFTAKSDVFSLGIVMWEIVTLGATPYENLTSAEVFTKVTSGQRLDRPAHCKDEFFSIMERCWRQNPTERPSFREVADELETLLLSETNYIELDRYPEHAYYNITNMAEKEVVVCNVDMSIEDKPTTKESKLLTFV